MNPFTIACTTCQARLKVRDPAAVGQIFACPKCGSMVLVEPPSEPSAAESGIALPSQPLPSSEALPSGQPLPSGQETIADPSLYDEVAAKPKKPAATAAAMASSSLVGSAAPPAAAPPAASSRPVAGSPGDRVANSSTSGARESADRTSPAEPATVDSSQAMPTADPVLPTAAWNSPTTQQWKQWLALGGAAVGGVVLAVGLFGFLTIRGEKAAATDDRDLDATAASISSQPDIEKPTRAEPVATDDEERDESPDPDQPIVPTPEPPDPADAPADSGDSPALPTTAPVAPETDLAGNGPPAAEATDDPAGPPDLVPRDEPDQKPARPKPLPDRVGSHTPTIDFSALTDHVTQNVDAASAEVAPAPVELVEESPRERPAIKPVNVAARLADNVPAVQFEDVPLADFLQFVSDFSTIPVMLDTDSLLRVGVSPESQVNVKQADTNVAGMLAAALEPRGLGFEATEGQLVVRAADESSSREREVFGVSDLARDEAALRQLAELVKTLVDPSSWNDGRGRLTVDVQGQQLVLEHNAAVRFQTGLFLDKLRTARGLAPRGGFAESLVSLIPRRERATSKLSTNVIANFGRPTRLTRILSYLGERTGTRILVDWKALAQVDWTPATQTSVVIHNESLGDALVTLLQPLDLTYRVVDEQVLVVTSRPTAAARWEIEFYGWKAPGSPEAIQQRIAEFQATLGEGLFAGPHGSAALHYDAASGYLIARLPQEDQETLRQLLIAEMP